MSVTIDIEVDGVNDLINDLKAYQIEKRRRVANVLDRTALRIERSAKRLVSGPGRGRVYRRGGVTHQASAPGEPPATDTGRLRSSIATRKIGPLTREIGAGVASNVEYAKFLEYGTGRRGASSGVDAPAGYTYGPRAGMHARPFMTPTWLREKPRYIRKMKKVFDD